MLVAATVCPHPPLLVPEVSVAAPDWLASLRHECKAAVRTLAESGPDEIVVVGAGTGTHRFGPGSGGSLRPYGVDLDVGGSEPGLPLSLTIGCWLLDTVAWPGARSYVSLSPRIRASDAAAIGADLVSGDRRVGLLVMGDGSAKRSTSAPGYLDPRAEPFDAAVVNALGDRDLDFIRGIDRDLADDLWVAGVPAWQCLAGALAGTPVEPVRFRVDDAPRGVGYFVVEVAIS